MIAAFIVQATGFYCFKKNPQLLIFPNLWQVRDLLIELKQQNKIAESERVSKELFKQVTTTIGRSVTRCGEIWLFGYFFIIILHFLLKKQF